MQSIDEVLDFWFGEEARPRWFDPTAEFDEAIRGRFGQLWEEAAKGGLDDWQASADGCLALCILLDQMPRNMFRGEARAFATDERARRAAEHALAQRFDRKLLQERRQFLYLPFQHSENVGDQLRSFALFERLGSDEGRRYAEEHLQIIRRFGRFPHRNAALGRESTEEEAAFLRELEASAEQSWMKPPALLALRAPSQDPVEAPSDRSGEPDRTSGREATKVGDGSNEAIPQASMQAGAAIAEILKREGVEIIFGYPVNHVLEFAARAEIRPIIVRHERVGLHMADALSRLSSGEKIGVFAMQHGPGTENAFGGIAQAWGESVPVLVLPMGYPRRLAHVQPNFNAVLNMRGITKSCEPVGAAAEIRHILRRAFTRLRSGRGGPVLVEIPTDVFAEEVAGPLDYRPTARLRSAPDPEAVGRAARRLLEARRPVIYAGQGVHYAKAWPELKRLAERLAAPVTTSLQGKSAFPEDHPLALGSGGRAVPAPVHRFLKQADLIFGIGCSFTSTSFGVPMPKAKAIVHATLDPMDVNKDVECELALLGDARLTLEALLREIEPALAGRPRDLGPVAREIEAVREPWLAEWMPRLTSDEVPLSPYRVLWDLAHTVDRANTIVTHDAGSPRDQLSPFWIAPTPLSYLGWGKTTQLGYGLGLAMGAKLARPEKLCVNVWGDAAIGFTGMDFETAVRERIPILSILLNNFSMAIELKVMPVATERYRATDISGDYAAMARAFGGYGERVTTPSEIVPAIRRGIAATEQGQPALLEFITSKEVRISTFE